MGKDRLTESLKGITRSKLGRTALFTLILASSDDSGRINQPLDNGCFCPNNRSVYQNKSLEIDGENVFPIDRFMKSIYAVAIDKRLEKEIKDTEYWHRVDKKLNHERVNILLFSYGELYEQPQSEIITIGSPTIISYNVSSRSIDLISLTHEMRSPEVERYLHEKGQFDGYAKRMDESYFAGGFELMRPVVESATGLSVDFQVAFQEIVTADAIDQLFGSIKVDVPLGFNTFPFHFRGKWYPMDNFSKGEEMMDGTRAIQFMKTIPYEKEYKKDFENNTRKHAFFESLKKAFESSDHGPHFWWKVFLLLHEKIGNGELTYDFDLRSLLFNNIGHISRLDGPIIDSGSALNVPRIGVKLYISDPGNGDGGVQWITASQNPIFKNELNAGFYPN